MFPAGFLTPIDLPTSAVRPLIQRPQWQSNPAHSEEAKERTISLEFPLTTQLTNYHVWLSGMLIELYAVEGIGEWAELTRLCPPILRFREAITTIYGIFEKVGMSTYSIGQKFLEDCGYSQEVISKWGNEREAQVAYYIDNSAELRAAVAEYKKEFYLFEPDEKVKIMSAESAQFDEWYAGNYPLGSSVHRYAVRSMCIYEPDNLAVGCWLASMPAELKIIHEIEKTKKSSPPTTTDHGDHSAVWTEFNDFYICQECQMTQAEYEAYAGRPGYSHGWGF